MPASTIQHLDAYRFPSDGLDRSEEDFYLLEGEYTSPNLTNPDGTLLWQTDIFAHGSREDIRQKIESIIEDGTWNYRSSKRGDDYFRAGVRSALDDALDADADLASRVQLGIGYRPPSDATDADNATDPAYQAFGEIIKSDPWKTVELAESEVAGEAPAISAAIDGMLRVEEMQANGIGEIAPDELRAFRHFMVTEGS